MVRGRRRSTSLEGPGPNAPRFGTTVENITVKIEVPRKVALLAAIPEFGSTTYQPTSDQLSELDQAERAWLDSKLSTSFTLDAPTVAWPAVLEAVRRDRRKELEAREEAVQNALAASVDRWFTFSYGQPGFYIPFADDRDHRIKARLEELRPELDRRVAEHARQVAERDAQREAEKEARAVAEAEKKAVEETAVADIKAWAEQQDYEALSRAAKEGYAVTNAVLKFLAESLAGDLCGQVDRMGSARWSRWDFEERAAPSEAAFMAWDEAAEAVEALEKPESVTVVLQRVSRISETADNDNDNEGETVSHYTAIIILIDAPIASANMRAVIVRVDE